MTTAHDFDFLHGRWRVRNRRLRRPLAGCTEWYEFDGESVERPLWDGRANLEEYEATLPDGARLRGLALRLYDPHAGRWTIHWSNAATGTLDPPVTGGFRDGVGEFHGDDACDGRPVRVRFRWHAEGPDAARWEQAFSADGGATWETNWVMAFTRAGAAAPQANDTAPHAAGAASAVVELRHYVLHPGARETLIALFEREFVAAQEAAGMRLLGQFRDLDRPDAFTWLRGFADMGARDAALRAFYGGPVWAAHRDAANATMVSSDDVRLLRPVRPETALSSGAAADADALVVATIYTLAPDAAAAFPALFERLAVPRLTAAGARPVAVYETEPAPNSYPRLPVREGEHAFVWFARFATPAAHDAHRAALAADPAWRDEAAPALERCLAAPVETMRLAPTARSRVPH